MADFYSRQAGLVIEVDGAGAHSSEAARAYDAERDAYMEALGLRVMRFTASEVCSDTDAVLDAIYHACRESVLPDDPQKQWRYAGSLAVGDTVYVGVEQRPVAISRIAYENTTEEVYDLEVEGAHSFVTETCTVHNCGSGTAATVAEQWGRRWITIDTSRVALALARARIMGARYPYYLLADSRDGQVKEAEVTHKAVSSQPTRGDIRLGFVYERVPHITLKSIANNAEIDVIWDQWQETLEPLREKLNAVLNKTWEEWEIPREADPKWPDDAKKLHAEWWKARIGRQKEIDASIAAKAEFEYLYDKPYPDNKKVRVAGPFTVESLSPHRVLGVDENDELIDHLAEPGADYDAKQSFPQMILENLRTAGVQQAHREDRINFVSLAPWPGDLICAEGRYVESGPETRPGSSAPPQTPLNPPAPPQTPLNPPASGGRLSPSPLAGRVGVGSPEQLAGRAGVGSPEQGTQSPSPLAAHGAGGDQSPSPLAGMAGVGSSESLAGRVGVGSSESLAGRAGVGSARVGSAGVGSS
ncbi:MAG TPA: DUF559 domain-containing protein, partial [Chloroflexota bacterium]|nr:DUF559 domain-containing protein [Chloroflexota bacterium]